MADVSQIKLPNGTTYTLKDEGALQLTGGNVTGPVSFGDSVSIDDLNAGQLVVSGSASVANNLQVNTINGVAVGSSPKFTDNNTTYSAGTGLSLSSTTFSVKLGYTTSGNNRAVQADSNGNLYVTQKDDNSNTTYTLSGALSSHKFTSTLTAGGSGSGTSTSEITFAAGSNVTLTDDTTNKKITIAATDTTYSSKAAASGGTDVSLVTTGEKYTWNSKTSNTGTITSVKTTAGAHTAINTTSGAVSFNVPTTAAHVGIKFGYTTSGNNRAVLQDSSGNLYVTQKDDNSGGTVTKVTAGTGLSIGTTAGGNFTTTGTINHTNSVTAQTTQAVYPIKIDAQGHISAYGSAQTILSIGTGASNAAAGNHAHSYLPLSGGTLGGDLLFSDSGTATRQVRGIAGANDYWRIAGGATASNAGWMEIATADDGNEPIYVRQYTGAYTTITRTLTLLDANGNTSLPGRLTTVDPINQIITGSGTAASDKGSGVSPRYFPAKWTFNTGQTATNGDIITIKIPVAGHSYGVFLSIDNGSHYHPVVVGNGTGRITTHYGNGTPIQLIFDSSGSAADMFALNGADARATVTGGVWRVLNFYADGNTIPQAYCSTAAGTAAKAASMSGYVATAKRHVMITITNANTSATAITMNINSTGAKPIYINGSASSTSNYTLPAGSYLVYYDGTNYYFRTDGHLQSVNGILTANAGTVTSITLTQGTGISIGSSGTAITTSGTRTIALATSGATAGTYGAESTGNAIIGGHSGFDVVGITVDKYGRITNVLEKTISIYAGDILSANAASGTSTTISTSTITQIPLTQTLVNRNYHSNLSLASNRIAIANAGTYRITGSIYITTTAAASVGVYIMKSSGAFSSATEIASSYIYIGVASSNSINVTKIIEATAGTYIYLGGRSSKGGTVASGNVATYLEVEELRF